MIFCRYCGAELANDARFCNQCGNALNTEQVAHKKPSLVKILIIAISVLLFMLITVFAVLIFVASGKTSAKQNVDSRVTTTIEPTEDVTTVPTVSTTIDQNPIPESNPYREYYTAAEYILPESDSRYYSPGELTNLSMDALKIAYAEISARHNEHIGDSLLNEYFSCLSWYGKSNSTAGYNHYEQENQFLINVRMRQLDGSLYNAYNPYLKATYLGHENQYFMAGSDSRYITGDELYKLSETELILARSEILARHGYIFEDDALQEYFCCKAWYQPTTRAANFNYSDLRDTENANIQLIEVYEDILDGVEFSYDNPYAGWIIHGFLPDGIVIHNSSTVKLVKEDLQFLDYQEVIIARNEIFARHGYSFTDKHLMEYFLHCWWYRPQVAPGRTDLISLNSTERANVNLLLEYQKCFEGKLSWDEWYDWYEPVATEPKPTNPQPTEPKPAETKPIETQPVVTTPVETQPTEPLVDVASTTVA